MGTVSSQSIFTNYPGGIASLETSLQAFGDTYVAIAAMNEGVVEVRAHVLSLQFEFFKG